MAARPRGKTKPCIAQDDILRYDLTSYITPSWFGIYDFKFYNHYIPTGLLKSIKARRNDRIVGNTANGVIKKRPTPKG